MCEGQTITRVEKYSTGGSQGLHCTLYKYWGGERALSGDSLGDVKILFQLVLCTNNRIRYTDSFHLAFSTKLIYFLKHVISDVNI